MYFGKEINWNVLLMNNRQGTTSISMCQVIYLESSLHNILKLKIIWEYNTQLLPWEAACDWQTDLITSFTVAIFFKGDSVLFFVLFCFVLVLTSLHRLAILPPQLLQCWDFRCAPLYLPLLLCWFWESNSGHAAWQLAASPAEPLGWSFLSFKRSVFISHHLNGLEHLTLMATVCI